MRLGLDELTRIVYAAACRDPRRAWTLLLSYGLGTRRMEVAGLKPADIIVGGDGLKARVTGKRGKVRDIEVGPLAQAALEELRPWYNGTVLGGVQRSTVSGWARKAAEDAGLEEKVRGRPSHILRAAFATNLLTEGVDPIVVRDLLGHESIATTNAYAMASEEEQRKNGVGRLPG